MKITTVTIHVLSKFYKNCFQVRIFKSVNLELRKISFNYFN